MLAQPPGPGFPEQAPSVKIKTVELVLVSVAMALAPSNAQEGWLQSADYSISPVSSAFHHFHNRANHHDALRAAAVAAGA